MVLGALLSTQARAGSPAQAQAFDWAEFIQEKQPGIVLETAIYVGGPRPFRHNASSIRFRPASTQKLFTASAYVEKLGWNDQIPLFLKKSVNKIGDQVLAPALGDGSMSKGAQVIEDFVNETIHDALHKRGIVPRESVTLDEFSQKTAKKNPYHVYCESGSGIDGGQARMKKGKDLDRSLITAEAMHLFLEELKEKPYFLKILRSLPYAGMDGTLKERMLESPATGTVAAKTGYVWGVKNLAGYIHINTEDGQSEFIPFVLLIRHDDSNIKKVERFADALVNRMAEELGATKIPYPPFKYKDPN